MACHHRPWMGNTVERRRAWHAITALGQHTRSDDVGRVMPSSPMGSTNGRTTSGARCHHRLLKAHTVERRRAWHAIITFGQHKQSDLQSKLNDVERGIPLSPLGSTHGRTTSGVACHYCLWVAQTVERRQAWHDIIAFGLAHTVGRRRVWYSIIALGRQTR